MSRSRGFVASAALGAALSAALGAALGAVAFGAGPGTEIARTTTVEVLIVLGAGVLLALAALRGVGGRLHGAAPLALFAVLATVTALSMTWSIGPDLTLAEAARTFAYLAAFAAALVAARIAPDAAPAVLGGLLMASVAVAGWALATRVWPGTLGSDVIGARLSEPLGYWNALGSMAALGTPAAVWLGARRGGRTVSSALAYPALGVLLLTILLTQSRGALGASIIAALVWLAVVPLRLRSIPVIVLPALGAAPVAAWALSKDAFTKALQPPSALDAVAGDFGLMVVAMCVGLLAVGLLVAAASSRRAPSLPLRRRVGLALAVVACALPLVGLTSVAVSDRGLGGTISDRVDDLTTDTVAPPRGAARLGSVSSSRGGYWRQAGHVFKERPAEGTGAGTFGLSSLRYRKDGIGSRHAHGFIPQTMADLGIIGLVAALALLAAWLASAARGTGLSPRRRPGPGWPPERAALVALGLCAVVFGLHSLVDWIWFVPGPSVAAIVAAGFVAGRGPLEAVGARAGVPAEGARIGGPVLAGAVLVTAALCAWAVWQPERSDRAGGRALALLDRGDLRGAAREADRARDIDPYSAEPLYAQAAVLSRSGHQTRAYRTLEQAVIEHPRDPETWLRLGRYELDTLDLPQRALETALATFRVDPFSRQAAALRDRATALLEERAQ